MKRAKSLDLSSLGLNPEAERPAFMAFVSDPESLQVLYDVAEQFLPGAAADKFVYEGGIEAAIGELATTDSPRLLVIDISESSDPLTDIDQLAEVCQPGTTVVALGVVNDIGLFRGLIAAGVADYLIKPVDADVLLTALHAAQSRAAEADRGKTTEERSKDEPGGIIAVMGTRGGIGTTMVAVNTAWIIAQELKHRVVLVDLDIHFGTACLNLDIEAGHGLCEALEDPSRVDGLFIASSAVNVTEDLYVLGSEEPLDTEVVYDAAGLELLLQELRQNFEWIVLDLPRGDTVLRQAGVAAADAVAIVSDSSLAGLRDMVRLHAFVKAQTPGARIVPVLNRVGSTKVGVVRKGEFEKGIDGTIDHLIPEDAKSVVKAMNAGKSLAAAAKGSKVTAELRRLSRALTGEEEVRKSFGLWRRRSKRDGKAAGKEPLGKQAAAG